MLKGVIKEKFGIQVRQLSVYQTYECFQTPNSFFLIIPVSQFSEAELTELYYMSQYLQEQSDPYVSVFIFTKDGELTFEQEGKSYALLKAVPPVTNRSFSVGAELAEFHRKGRGFPYEVKDAGRIGQWKDLWGKRIDQLEAFWQQKIQMPPHEPFDKKMIESFPYYLGLSENAVQYLVDTELDDKPQVTDSGTICHQRMERNTWSPESLIRIPADWVFDHAARDLAEYMRHTFLYHREDLLNQGFHFLQEYEQITPLSSFSKRLMYSRLLFPLHYFETVEGYYISSETEKHYYEENLDSILADSGRYEQFLNIGEELMNMRSGEVFVPSVTWLGKGTVK
ncbi:spore coat putative kinase YutH [Bacillus atrophaeus]|uniref:spore coat putative kinase YutH n=1 Tax=Bacillus atrophaeus TaxID=1452 RepID=UPI0022817AAA|nr:spore coat protein YutH [Bacillus atrophaeus]MCY8960552.1 spore coat protein YutH [Bacillus atrophaeus]MCY8962243.1 spore coat protein YutH [Bacillus atrophaeus]MCY9438952.1 spore coat protein YutH [Bacillus atrophaeus]MEC0649823.1 spore coat protein YutH [Bacillus atrophaeus]MED4803713.1 spore coat protein YutH [Bacillus atrophaeus]